MYRAVATSLSKREAALIDSYREGQLMLDEELAAQYKEIMATLDASMASYLAVLERAFDPDIQLAFLGSVELATELGVPAKEILDTNDKALAYFLD